MKNKIIWGQIPSEESTALIQTQQKVTLFVSIRQNENNKSRYAQQLNKNLNFKEKYNSDNNDKDNYDSIDIK